MFTGSIAVPRPGGEGCSRVVGSLSAVWGVVLVFPSPVEVLVSWLQPSARFVLGTALGLSQKRFGFSVHPLGC